MRNAALKAKMLARYPDARDVIEERMAKGEVVELLRRYPMHRDGPGFGFGFGKECRKPND